MLAVILSTHRQPSTPSSRESRYRIYSPPLVGRASHMGASPLFLSPMGRGRGPLRSNGKVRAAALSGLFSIDARLALPSPRRGDGNPSWYAIALLLCGGAVA